MCNWCYTNNPDRDDRDDRERGMQQTSQRGGSGYSDKDAKRDTAASDRELSEANHQARDDAESSGYFKRK